MKFKYFMIITILSLSLVLSGCLAEVRVKQTHPDTGIINEASYTRWGNQAIGSFSLNLNGTVTFSAQKSDTEIAFGLGALSATLGGKK